MASESNDGARLNEQRVKALTGCDSITAQFLHSEFFTFEPVAKFWIGVNHKPIVRDDSFGFWRRIRLLPFEQTFTVNPRLATELRAEAPGILVWAVHGCLAWQREGLKTRRPRFSRRRTSTSRRAIRWRRSSRKRARPSPRRKCRRANSSSTTKRRASAQGLGDRERLTATMLGRKMAERFSRVHRGGCAWYRGSPGDDASGL